MKATILRCSDGRSLVLLLQGRTRGLAEILLVHDRIETDSTGQPEAEKPFGEPLADTFRHQSLLLLSLVFFTVHDETLEIGLVLILLLLIKYEIPKPHRTLGVSARRDRDFLRCPVRILDPSADFITGT